MGNLDDDPLLEAIPVVDGYKFLAPCFLYARIGAGGMGTVYRGRHTNLDIDVAIKCLNPSLAQQDRKFVTRFHREAKLAASIDQANLIRVFDVGSQNDLHYIVMEYVRGETARERVVRKGPLSESEALAILLGAASALAAAHARGVVHRDIKPDNIMISVDGRVKVADLGLAKPLGADSTLTHGIMGTPKYMAPEQWTDPDLVGPWTDVWALGATFFFLAAGHDPFRGASAGQPFPLVHDLRPDLSPEAADLLARCVCGDHEQRFAHAGLLLQRLRALRGHDIGDDLADPAAARTMTPHTLVSPPPYRSTPTRTIARVERDPPATGATREVPAATPVPAAVLVPTARSARSRIGWLALGVGLVAGATWWFADGSHRTAATVTACRDALASGDLDLAVRLGERLPAAEAAGLRADLADRLTQRAEQSRLARKFTGALQDFRRARELVPDLARGTACTLLEETMRAALRASTTLSLAPGSVVGKLTKLEVRGPQDLARCTVQGVTKDLSAGNGWMEIVCKADGPFDVEVQLEHAAGVEAPLPLSLIGDVAAPEPTVVQPPAGAVSRSPVALRGTCSDTKANVWIGDRKVEVVDGRWALSLELGEGSHELAVVAEDAVGNRSDVVPWSVVVDTTPPPLELDEVPTAVEDERVDVAGTTEPGSTVTVAGEPAPVDADGAFRSSAPLPRVGRNEVVVAAHDRAGNVASRTLPIERQPPPAITVLEPATERAEWAPVVVVRGRVRSGVRSLAIGGVAVPFDAAGGFVHAGQFEPGPLELVAIDADGNQQQVTLALRPPRELQLVVDAPPAGADPTVWIRGRTEPDALVRIGDRVVTAGADGRFEVAVVLPGPGAHEVAVNAWRAGAPAQLGVALSRISGAPARVESVQPDTAAAFVDLRPGDVIEAIDDRATDAQGVLTVVAGSTASLELRVRRDGERRAVTVTPWPSPVATVRTRAEVAPVPDVGIVPVFGIEPGVTTRADVERIGTAVDRDRLIFEVHGHEVTCDERVAERVVLASSPLPTNWVRAGLNWGAGQQEVLAWIERKWRCREQIQAAAARDGVLVFDVRPGLRVTFIFPRGELRRAEIKRVR